jgi:hypothetical protein
MQLRYEADTSAANGRRRPGESSSARAGALSGAAAFSIDRDASVGLGATILIRSSPVFVARPRVAAGNGGGNMQSAEEGGNLPGEDDELGDEIRRRITELQVEHRDLDQAIAQLGQRSGCDELQLRRLKKRKLLIKDAITRLEMGLVPDIPA